MAVKLLINGQAGMGKTELLRSLDEDTFVVSRDAKNFSLPLPFFQVDTWVDMDTFLNGTTYADGTTLDGVVQKIEKYHEHYGKYPSNVAIDSVSQIFMDVIDTASQKPNVYGSQGAEVTAEMAKLTKFIHETLEMSGMNVILLNHVIPEKMEGKETGNYLSFGSGKFLEKGSFFSTVNEAVTLTVVGEHRKVTLRGTSKLARTTLPELPDSMWVANPVNESKSKKLKDGEEYYTLKSHLDLLLNEQANVSSFAL